MVGFNNSLLLGHLTLEPRLARVYLTLSSVIPLSEGAMSLLRTGK